MSRWVLFYWEEGELPVSVNLCDLSTGRGWSLRLNDPDPNWRPNHFCWESAKEIAESNRGATAVILDKWSE